MEPVTPGRRRAPVWRLLVVTVMLVAAVVGLDGQEALAADAIENQYEMAGPWAVTYDEDGDFTDTGETCSPSVAPVADFTIVYPTLVGNLGDHPVVVWGNGTGNGANPTCSYNTWLRHLASWGFVVIAPNTGQAGTGDALRAAADVAYWVDAANTPGNPFYDDLDTNRMTAAGHSQGAVGAINATIDAPNSVFSSVLAMSTPDRSDLAIYNDPACPIPVFCCTGLFGSACVPVPTPTKAEMSTLDAPIFFVRGSLDPISDQTPADYYPNASPPVPYAAATRVGADHFDLTSAFGYMTAWIWYTNGYCPGPGNNPIDPEPAFRGASPEIQTQPTIWQGITLQNLIDCV